MEEPSRVYTPEEIDSCLHFIDLEEQQQQDEEDGGEAKKNTPFWWPCLIFEHMSMLEAVCKQTNYLQDDGACKERARIYLDLYLKEMSPDTKVAMLLGDHPPVDRFIFGTKPWKARILLDPLLFTVTRENRQPDFIKAFHDAQKFVLAPAAAVGSKRRARQASNTTAAGGDTKRQKSTHETNSGRKEESDPNRAAAASTESMQVDGANDATIAKPAATAVTQEHTAVERSNNNTTTTSVTGSDVETAATKSKTAAADVSEELVTDASTTTTAESMDLDNDNSKKPAASEPNGANASAKVAEKNTGSNEGSRTITTKASASDRFSSTVTEKMQIDVDLAKAASVVKKNLESQDTTNHASASVSIAAESSTKTDATSKSNSGSEKRSVVEDISREDVETFATKKQDSTSPSKRRGSNAKEATLSREEAKAQSKDNDPERTPAQRSRRSAGSQKESHPSTASKASAKKGSGRGKKATPPASKSKKKSPNARPSLQGKEAPSTKKKPAKTDELEIPSFGQVRKSLEKVGYTFKLPSRGKQIYCRPARDGGGKEFTSVEAFRADLCAYGVSCRCGRPTGDQNVEEACECWTEDQAFKIHLWVRYCVIQGRTKTVKFHELSPGDAMRMLRLIGFNYLNAGLGASATAYPHVTCREVGIEGKTMFENDKDLFNHLSRFGLPSSCDFAKITAEERASLEYFVSTHNNRADTL